MSQAEEIKKKENWFYTFQVGYQFLSLPLNAFQLSSTSYYLVVINSLLLSSVFTNYWMFLLFLILTGIPFIWFVGVIFIRSPWYRGQTKLQPYSYLITPNQFELYLTVADLAERGGMNDHAVKLREIVEESKRV
jgi:hypothetical protein